MAGYVYTNENTFDPLCDHREVLFQIVPVHVAWNLVVLSCPFTVVL